MQPISHGGLTDSAAQQGCRWQFDPAGVMQVLEQQPSMQDDEVIAATLRRVEGGLCILWKGLLRQFLFPPQHAEGCDVSCRSSGRRGTLLLHGAGPRK